LVILVFVLRKRNFLISLGILWYLIGLVPKFYATLKVPASEHHFYFPSIGVYMVLLAGLEMVSIKRKKILYLTIAIILSTLSVITLKRNQEFKDPLLIWKIGTLKESNHIGNWLNLGLAYKEKGELKKAKQAFNKALTLFNKDKEWKAGLYQNIAGVYFLESNYQKAIEFLKKGINLNPNSARLYQLYNDLGILYEKIKNKEKALECWKKALELNPYAWKIYQNLAKVYIESNNLEKAKKYTEKAIKLYPRDFYSYFLLGKIYEKKSDFKKAASFYKKSIELEPNWFYTHYALSLIYIKLKDNRFLKELEKSIELNPNFRPAFSLYEFIKKLNLKKK